MDTGGRTAGLVELALVLAALGATVLEPNLRNQSIRSLSNVFLDVQQQSRPERVLR